MDTGNSKAGRYVPAATDGRVGRRLIIGYAAGSLGTGIYSSVPSVLLLYFMTDTLGIAAGLASLAVFIPKIWDVITDPLMGYISDRTRSRWGRRRPYLAVGAVSLGLTFVFLFNVPDFGSAGASFTYVLVVFLLSATAYTVFSVPYTAMSAEMTPDYHERTVIVAYRMSFAIVGIMIGAAAAPMLVAAFGGGKYGYSMMSMLMATACVLSMLLAFFATGSAPGNPGGDSGGFIQQLRVIRRNRAFVVLILVYFLQLTAVGVFSAAVPYYVVYIAGGGEAGIGAFFLVLFSFAVLAMPVWTSVSRRIAKKHAFVLSAAIFGVATLLLPVATDIGDSYRLFAIAVAGIGFAGIQMLPYSMLTDTIHIDSRLGGRREGAYTGVWIAAEKFGLAIGPIVVGTLLGLHGFVASSADEVVQQSDRAIGAIHTAISVVPGGVLLISTVGLMFYTLTREDLEL